MLSLAYASIYSSSCEINFNDRLGFALRKLTEMLSLGIKYKIPRD